MPIVIRATVPGMTRDQYNHMSEQMLAKIKGMKGFIAHAGRAVPGGWEVTEFWESHELFDVWIKETVMPASMAAGITPPIMEISPAERAITK